MFHSVQPDHRPSLYTLDLERVLGATLRPLLVSDARGHQTISARVQKENGYRQCSLSTISNNSSILAIARLLSGRLDTFFPQCAFEWIGMDICDPEAKVASDIGREVLV